MFIILWTIYVIVAALAMCHPIALNWDKSINHGSCGQSNASFVAICAWGIALDLAIFISPIPVIWKLNMPRAQRASLTLLFALGLLCVTYPPQIQGNFLIMQFSDIITGVMRLVNANIGPANVIEQGLIWGVLEPSIAIMVACFPMYRPIAERHGCMSIARSTIKSWTSSGKRHHGQTEEDQIELVKTPQSKSRTKASGRMTDHTFQTSSEASVASKIPPLDSGQVGVKKDITVLQT